MLYVIQYRHYADFGKIATTFITTIYYAIESDVQAPTIILPSS
jgi:hypothetical protein